MNTPTRFSRTHAVSVAFAATRLLFGVFVLCASPGGTSRVTAKPKVAAPARDREIAARFAPVFYQGLGDHPRHDYITNFDFDADWRGDNNWKNSADPRFPLKAYIYYAVSETRTHYFIHYAVFHPRDYKGGESRGPFLSEIIREGVKLGGKYDPTGRVEGSVLAHENDMEGCLVVALKYGVNLAAARVVYVETLAHNRFNRYTVANDVPDNSSLVASDPDSHAGSTDDSTADIAEDHGKRRFVRLERGHPLLYVEPKGHGILAYDNDDGEKQSPRAGWLIYSFTGRAEVPVQSLETPRPETVGYELTPLISTIWTHAHGGSVNQTFGDVQDFGTQSVNVAQAKGQVNAARQVKLGALGTAFRGSVGANNMARPPWGWFDRTGNGEAHGAWFFDPATTIKRHFNLSDDFSIAYLHAPFLGIVRRSK